MVVALDLERDRETVTEVEHARVLAGALEDTRPCARESAEQKSRVLVAAMLRPEHGEKRQFERVRLALQEFVDTVELPVREAERPMEQLFRDGGQGSSVDAWSAGRSRCPISRRPRLDR